MGRLVKRPGRVVPAEIPAARADAEAILRAAAGEAERVLAMARSDAELIRAEARRAGEAEGRREAEAAFTTLILAARADAEKVRVAAIPAAQTLAVRMAEKIVGRTLRLDPSSVAHIAAEALVAARARTGTVVLRVHPDDLGSIEAARPALQARLAAIVDLRLVPDAVVGHGGCIVETPAGRLDARLETQLAVLRRAAFGDWDGAPGERTSPHG